MRQIDVDSNVQRPSDLSDIDLRDLRSAKFLLENPGLAARLADLMGKPIEAGISALPKNWKETVTQATRKALIKGLEFAVKTLGGGQPQRSRNLMHKLMVTTTGVTGGAFGLASLPIELPVSTCIMLRSIADIARSEGHNVGDLSTQLACLEVLALGGKNRGDDASETGYWAVRAVLAKAVSEAATFIAQRGLVEEGAPPLVRLIAVIAARFSVVVSEEVAAKAIPVVGAVGGGMVNYLFMDHFQDMARGHFIVRRLERVYGTASVQRAYSNIALAAFAILTFSHL
jgi:hypothetical protein